MECKARRELLSKLKIRTPTRNRKTVVMALRKRHNQLRAKDWTVISSSSNLPSTTNRSMMPWVTRDQLVPRSRLRLRNKPQRLLRRSQKIWDLNRLLKRMSFSKSRRAQYDHRSHALVPDLCLIPAQDLHQRALLLFNLRSSQCLPEDSRSQAAPESQDLTPKFLGIQSEKPATALVSIQPNFSSRRIVSQRFKENMKTNLAFLRIYRTTLTLICRPNKARKSKNRARSQLRTKWCYLVHSFRSNRAKMEFSIQFLTVSTPMIVSTTHSWKTKSVKHRPKLSSICKLKKRNPMILW